MALVSHLRFYNPKSKYLKLMVDANFVIQYADSAHDLNRYVQPAVEKLLLDGVRFFYPDFCLREFREYYRKLFLQKFLAGYIKTKSLGVMPDAIISGWESGYHIRDRDFKDIRNDLEKQFPEHGYEAWFNLCQTALHGQLQLTEQMIKYNHFQLISLGDLEFPVGNKNNWPSTDTEVAYTNQFGLGTIDSALIDWFARATGLDGLVSNDHDILSAQLCGAVPGATFYTTLSRY